MTGRQFLEILQNSKYIDESLEFLIGEQIHKGNINIQDIMNSYFSYMEKIKDEYENDLRNALRIIHFKNSDILEKEEKEFINKYESKLL